ncbi:hypothetical protein Tco_0446409 [Tanacetum coccineum]
MNTVSAFVSPKALLRTRSGHSDSDGTNLYGARATGATPGTKSIWNSTCRVGDSDKSDDDEPAEMIKDQKLIHHLSGSPTPSSDAETDTLLPHHDSTSPEVDDDMFDPEGDILFLEGLLNNEISSDLPLLELINDPEGDISFLENLLKDEPLEANKSEINPLIREPPNTFLMGGEEFKLNSHEDIDDHVPIPRVFKKPLDSLDCISNTFDMTITDPLFDLDSEFTLNSDNPIFGIHNEDECFDPGDDIDEIDAFLDMDVSTDIEDGYYDSEGDIIYLESLLIKDTTHNPPPEVFLDHDPKSLKDEPDNLNSMVKVFDPGIHEKTFLQHM